MDLDFVSVHKHAKKELGQYPVILTSRLVNNPYFLYLPTQIRFLIGGERVTCHWSKLHDALGRTLHDALGQQQLELSTHTWSGRAPLKRRQICTPADVKQIIFICVLFYFELGGITKHLMTWPQGKQWVLFPRDPQCSPRRSRGKHWGRGFASGNIEGLGETKLTVSLGASH